MKNVLKASLMTLVLFMAAQLTYAQVKSDYNKDADFSKYKTYTFAGWEKNSSESVNDFDKKRILDALKSEFDSRGMTLAETGGDATITLFIVVDEKTSTTAYTTYNGGMGYGGRWGWGYGAGGMGTSTTSYSENDYTEGTLVVDMYDTESKDLVWQGILTAVVKEKPEKREKGIPKKISKLMKTYPVAATK
ncbi:DUF4136 domain-containing protein [Reichenbachiella agarivorans]|uniref:DUF4136 domain-containing protein n=1 Tax=Reichenbachiella agarivorans TaxID=2979464 RepID=A0ABY6CMQ0_9BACT|nr:DUF4136 domain-containing protein [Reichenbachiella agarivorans]UXP31790.1 DUF4136 domain-containing protein [Reichenbachiella agarivorans]